MKRDMDLVRQLLVDYESSEDIIYTPSKIENFNNEEIMYHLKIMEDAGLLEELYYTEMGYQHKIKGYRLTWTGHDFLEASRDDERWAKAKDTAGKVGVFTIEILKQILTQLIQTQLKQVMG